MNMQRLNPFERVWALGYHRLCPIVPPGAPLSERSSLARRIRSNPKADARGKTPGVRWPDGTWSGFDFVNHESTEADLARWAEMGAGIGIKTGQGLVLIDADTVHEDRAAIIKATIQERLGALPVRIGRYPKAGYLVRTDAEFQYARVEFGERDGKNRLLERVEMLAEGRQFVAEGIHPGTLQPYRWPQGLPPYAEVPYASAEALTGLLAALAPLLPSAGPVIVEGATGEYDQAGLAGDPAAVARAVAALPNTTELFPSRESWRDVGYAIKAALPGNADMAFELFADWSGRWEDPDPEAVNDPDTVAADWGRMKPPYRRGASWLFELAEKHGGGSFSRAELWLDPPGSDTPLFPENLPNAFGNSEGDYFDVLTIEDLFNRPDPKFVIDRHLPEQSVGFLYGDPGTGKSFIALDWALHMAFRRPAWHGDALAVKEGGAVIYLAGEGASGFKTRVAAWMLRHGIPETERGRFVLLGASVNFMQPDDVRKLARTIRDRVACPVAMVVADTVSRSMPGADENLQKEMTLFVKACDVLRDAFACVVLGVHHAGKAGDMRGSTVLLGAGDFVFKLSRKKGAAIGALHCEKQKDAPDGWEDRYRFDMIALGDGRSSLVPTRCDAGSVSDGAVLTPDLSERVLAAMAAAWREGRPWKLPRQAREMMAARCMVSQFGFEVEAAEQLLATWLGMGVIREEIASRKSKMKGLFVVGENDESAPLDGAGEEQEASVFD